MRISDWSSDVCSSDLAVLAKAGGNGAPARTGSTRCRARRAGEADRKPGAATHAAQERPDNVARTLWSGDGAWPPPHDDRGSSACTGNPAGSHDRAGARHDHHVAARLDSRDEGSRSEEHTSELQSLMRTSYAVFCIK